MEINKKRQNGHIQLQANIQLLTGMTKNFSRKMISLMKSFTGVWFS